ncbi:MAG TPA: uroporphyrinogen-III synthase [Nitrospirales bacterium]|nr:uroporphyrinogen-III synthase [Nitrospiraceae bacterium]HNP29985.1 uroporphyrinogen-III synthase [Nitrospirales bacterium]
MSGEQSKAGFQGLRIGALESRMATEMERMIIRHGGVPVVAPSMRELPLSDNPQALDCGDALLAGQIDMVVLLTGVGFRTLLDVVQTRYALETITAALRNTVLVVRGPKPTMVLKELGLQPNILVPEPNTWRDTLEALDASYPDGLQGLRIAVQEYGVSNPEFLAGLRKRGAKVRPVPVYRWTLPDDLAPLKHLLQEVMDGVLPVLLITNAIQVEHLVKVLEKDEKVNLFRKALHRMMVASIGNVASERLRHYGFPVDLEPSHPKMGILVKEASQAVHTILATKNTPPMREPPSP